MQLLELRDLPRSTTFNHKTQQRRSGFICMVVRRLNSTLRPSRPSSLLRDHGLRPSSPDPTLMALPLSTKVFQRYGHLLLPLPRWATRLYLPHIRPLQCRAPHSPLLLPVPLLEPPVSDLVSKPWRQISSA